MLTTTPEFIHQLRADGLDDMLALHYDEVEDPHLPMDVDWPAYYRLEKIGALKLLACRRDGRLIGYASWFLQPTLHSRRALWAVCDTLYVEPGERHGRAGVSLIRASEQLLLDAGARMISFNTKVNLVGKRGHGSVGHLLRRLGYELAEESWIKRV